MLPSGLRGRLPADTLAHLECRLSHMLPAGDRVLLVSTAKAATSAGAACLFYRTSTGPRPLRPADTTSEDPR